MSEQTEKPMIYSSMAKILAEVDSVSKGKTSVGKFSFKYRGIDDVFNALHSAFAAHGVFMTQKLLTHTTDVIEGRGLHHLATYEFTFWAIDGSSISCVCGGECIENGDKGLGKTASYALKTCLLQTFLIPTEDDSKDPDSTNQPLPQNYSKGIVHTQVSTPRPSFQPATLNKPGEMPMDSGQVQSGQVGALKDAIIRVLITPGVDWNAKTGKSLEYLTDKTKSETDPAKLNSFWNTIQKLIQTES
jgi:hypothetical protein